MSDGEENESSLTSDLDYDLWEGQFEFVGPTEGNNCVPQGLLKAPPFLPNGTNGVRKTAAHRWCENVSDNVRTLTTYYHRTSWLEICFLYFFT